MIGPSGWLRLAKSTRSNSSNAFRTSGNASASSRSIPGDCAPWPGKRNATGSPDHAGCAAKKTPRGSSKLARPSAIAVRDSFNLSRRSSCEPARITSVGLPTEPDFATRLALAWISVCDRSPRMGRAGMQGMNQLIEEFDKLAGLFGLPDQEFQRPVAKWRVGLGDDVSLVRLEDRVEVCPTEPEGTDPGPSRSIGLTMEPGLRLRTEPEGTIGLLELGIGGLDADGRRQDVVISAKLALIRPARPAAHLVWPINDLTEPTTHWRSWTPASAKSRPKASTSTTSPRAVPVPWAST